LLGSLAALKASMLACVPGTRFTPCAAGPQVVAVEPVGFAGVTPCGVHQPPEDAPLSQRTVLKPSSSTWRLE
jgi:hypothetical protein